MPEVEPRTWVDVLCLALLMLPIVGVWLGALFWYARIERVCDAEALERIRLRNGAGGRDNGASGDDNYAGVGDVVRAETKP